MFIGKKPTDAPLTSSDVADGIITSAKIADGTIVNADVNASAAIAGSKLSGAGISVADQWRLTTTITSTNATISSNLERVDTGGQGTIGSAMSESSGIFTFPSTGIWLVIFSASIGLVPTDNGGITMEVTTNNSSYTSVGIAYNSNKGSANTASSRSTNMSTVDVTDTANVKVRFLTASLATDSNVVGDTDRNSTNFTFIRLGVT